jgi:hypothetical protein
MELLVIDSKTLVSIKMSGASESVMAVCIKETYFDVKPTIGRSRPHDVNLFVDDAPRHRVTRSWET